MTNHEHTHSINTNEDGRNMIPAAIIIAGALIAGAIYMGGSKPAQVAGTNPQVVPNDSIVVEKVTAKDHVLGSRDAKVMVIEYSDLECPFCKVFHSTMHQIMNAYGNTDVAWVYRHFPIQSLHSKAPKEAEATECAAEQGGDAAFWAYADKLIDTTTSNNGLDAAELPRIAGAIGLDVTAFTTCLNSGKYAAAIEADIAEATAAGARGTPYSVIVTKDGKKVVINGAEPFTSVKAKIDSLLK